MSSDVDGTATGLMEIRLASQAAPGRPANEDHGFVLPGLVGVLDGVTAPEGLDTGCVHGPAWYVQQLAARFAGCYARNPAEALSQLLADAIERVRGDHKGQCDLSHPGTPASTVTLLRQRADGADYLVLCDSPLVVDQPGGIRVVTDDRHAKAVAQLRATALDGRYAISSEGHATRVRHLATQQREFTNQPDGYWIAAASPAAAHEAVTGTLPLSGPHRVRRAALLTDGASCAVDEFALCDWRGLLDLLTDAGPLELIARVRAAELADRDGFGRPRYKRHDDATAAICLFEVEERDSAGQTLVKPSVR